MNTGCSDLCSLLFFTWGDSFGDSVFHQHIDTPFSDLSPEGETICSPFLFPRTLLGAAFFSPVTGSPDVPAPESPLYVRIPAASLGVEDEVPLCPTPETYFWNWTKFVKNAYGQAGRPQQEPYPLGPHYLHEELSNSYRYPLFPIPFQMKRCPLHLVPSPSK